MTKVIIKAGGHIFKGILEEEKAPETCKIFKKMMPFKNKLIHVRWSGQGMWIPYGDKRLELGYENQTSFPAKGEFLLYPGGVSEMEIIVAYGKCLFSSQVGQLAGNHFLTITEGLENINKLGEAVLWEGAKEVTIEYDEE